MGRPRAVVCGFVLAAVFVVAACGGGGATPTPAPTAAAGGLPSMPAVSVPGGGGGTGSTTDASKILTTDVAASIIGGSLTKAPIPAMPGMSLVSYENDSGAQVTALVEPMPAGTETAIMQAAIAAAGANGDLQTFSGLGDAAGKVVNDNDATVAFVKSNTLVVVYAQSDSASGSDLESKIESVARQIAGTL